MSLQSEAFYTFIVEWFDTQASLVRSFNLRYFPYDGQLDMYDVKNRRTFLKKCHYPSITLKDLYPGAQISIYARTLKVIDYADATTRSALATAKDPIILFMKPNNTFDYTEIFAAINDCGCVVANAKLCELTSDHVSSLSIPSAFTGTTLVIHAIGPNPNASLSALASRAPSNSILRNMYMSPSSAVATRQAPLLFNVPQKDALSTTTTMKAAAVQPTSQPLPVAVCSGTDCSVVIIKPHALTAGNAAGIMHALAQGSVAITGLNVLHLDRTAAAEFLEVYRGVVPEYNGLIDHLASGPCLALELKHAGASAAPIVPHVRQICGPHDPAIAQALRPNTIRARYGNDKVHNAVHCTDLAEDGMLESEYVFRILQ